MAKKEPQKQDTPISLRGLDKQLYLLARAEALKQGKPIGEWITEAIRAKLTKDGALHEKLGG